MSDNDHEADVSSSRADVFAYRPGLIVALFVVGVFAGLWLLGQTFFVGLGNWGRYSDFQAARDFPLYWVNVAALALTSFGIVWNVRAEYREGHRFVAGAVFAVLSFAPLLWGVWQLVATP